MGIERKGELITNPDPQLTFEVGDVVVAAGETLSIKKFVENNV
jgi:K+/H+ antiporter YhaU regulatory subunit KhtT